MRTAKQVQVGPSTTSVQRRKDPAAPGAPELAKVPASMAVSLGGTQFTPPGDAVFAAGSRLPQLLAMALRRLSPGVVSDEVVTAAAEMVVAQGIPLEGPATGTAKAGEKGPTFTVAAGPSLKLVAFLEEHKLPVGLSDKQRDLLRLGYGAAGAWQAIDMPQVATELGIVMPAWFSKGLFLSEAGSHGTELEAFTTAWQRHMDARTAGPAAVAHARQTLRALIAVVRPNVDILEAIRTDAALVGTPGYAQLWPLPKAKGGGQAAAPPLRSKAAGPAEKPDAQAASLFVSWAHTQPQLATNAADDPDARRELLVRFARYLPAPTGKSGDQEIVAKPGQANYPPWPSTLASAPALQPPLYEAALATDHAFAMQIQFQTVFDAFATYAFQWDRIRAPEPARKGEKQKAETVEKPTRGEVASARYNRVSRYNEEDLNRVIGNVGGVPGVGAVVLTEANNMLRYVGTTLRLGLEILTARKDEKQIVFPTEGIYVVRCIATPIPSDDAEVRRPPSVAYVPVLARNPQAMAERATTQAAANRGLSLARLSEVRMLLAGADVPDRAELEKERDELEAALGPIAANLETQKAALEKRRDSLPAGGSEREAVEKQLKAVEQRLDVRKQREEKHGLEGAETLDATFVSDLGQTVRLTLEAKSRTTGPGDSTYYVSDLTTPNSGDASGTAKNRPQAIMTALKTVLESTAGYGRGQLSVFIDDTVYNMRIAASAGSILMEAIENIATVASIAAVAAAPFTGGASLSLLLPIGLVGAIPSAYRLATRAQMSTLRLDLAAAMDIVNLVGSTIGLGQVATPLAYTRLGGALMVTGLGADGLGVLLMGAQMVEEIDKLKGELPGVRAAKLMEILGGAMIQAGIAIGSALPERAAKSKVDAGPTPVDPGTPKPSDPAGKAGGPHPGSGKAGAPGGDIPAAPRVKEPGLVAAGVSKDGQHEIKITDRGKVAVCSWPCQFLRDRFTKEIDDIVGMKNKVDQLDLDIEKLQTDLRDGTIDQATHDTGMDAALDRASGIEADLRAARHPYLELDTAAKTPRRIPHEGVAGMHLEDLLGHPVERSKHIGADFIDPRNGRSYDALGPVPPAHFDGTPREFTKWKESLKEHLGKTGLDVVFLDLSGLSPAQRSKALAELGQQLRTHAGKPAVVVYP